ncbi:SGNH/GDSL hydrolase family protein [Ornithinimicrobium tianjinense]|nr:SGNH/GDSL hydrolase family protein [Ornithinimicrobium tianjinense]
MGTREQGHRRPAAVAASVLALTVSSALPSVAAPDEVTYDALGDSYASGAGSGPLGACGQSEAAYPERLDARKKISLDDDNTCAGATVQTMLETQLVGLDDAELVTVTIGGNNIGWSQAIGACLAYDEETCEWAVGQSTWAITNVLPPLLDTAYAAVHASAPEAHVVVTGYPRLFSPEFGDYAVTGTPLVATVSEQQLLNAGADQLNAVIAAKAAEHGFQYVDVTEKFSGHGVNAPDAWITGAQDMVPFHPTAAGQDAYAAAVTSQLDPRSLR